MSSPDLSITHLLPYRGCILLKKRKSAERHPIKHKFAMFTIKLAVSQFVRNLNRLRWYHHTVLLAHYCHPLLFREEYSVNHIVEQAAVNSDRQPCRWAGGSERIVLSHTGTHQSDTAAGLSRRSRDFKIKFHSPLDSRFSPVHGPLTHTRRRSYALLWTCCCSTYWMSFKATGLKKRLLLLDPTVADDIKMSCGRF